MKYQIKIGTSGWTYPHWQDIFYPPDCPKAKWLEFYAEHFTTVELNASFYRLPQAKTFENWRLRTPHNFLWAVKASRYITHVKRLKEPKESLEKFYQTIAGLQEKLGPILFQLPPGLSFDENTFGRFCHSLDPALCHVLEVRNQTWINDKVFSILKDHNIAFCIADSAGRYPCHEMMTADFVYVRLHGSQKLYASKYSENELQAWAGKIRKWDKKTYIYFDNDFGGYAVINAKRLKEILR